MKKSILLVLFALTTIVSQAQKLKWMSMKEAVAAQKKTKNLFLSMPTPFGVVLVKCWIKTPFRMLK